MSQVIIQIFLSKEFLFIFWNHIHSEFQLSLTIRGYRKEESVAKLSVVVPILNEIHNLAPLRVALESLGSELKSNGHVLEIVLNDNCSDDGSSEFLASWASEDPRAFHFRFDKRLTFQQSILSGFRASTGDCLVVFQGDLQDPWREVLNFFHLWLTGSRVVVGIARNVHSNWRQTLGRKMFYWLLRIGTSSRVTVGFQDFYLLDQSVYRSIGQQQDKFVFIRGSIASEYKIDKVVEYERLRRKEGKTKFSFDEKYELALDGLLVHSSGFTRRLSLFGLILAGISCLGLLITLVVAVFGINVGAPGWLSLAAALALLLGVFSLVSALQLEYLRRLLVLGLDRFPKNGNS